jgi:hypothetical protein
MLSEQSNKDPLAFVEERRPLFSANGKVDPNPRTARAWQKKMIKETNVNKSRCVFCV